MEARAAAPIESKALKSIPLSLRDVSQGGFECLQIARPRVNGITGGEDALISVGRAGRAGRKLLSPLAGGP